MPDGVIGNTSDSGSEESRFETWSGNKASTLVGAFLFEQVEKFIPMRLRIGERFQGRENKLSRLYTLYNSGKRNSLCDSGENVIKIFNYLLMVLGYIPLFTSHCEK